MFARLGEHQSRTKGCSRYRRPKFAARNSSSAAKSNVHAPGLSKDECEHHSCVCDTLGLADRLRQNSHEGAIMLLVNSGGCLRL